MNFLSIKLSRNGKGVFAQNNFSMGEIVMRFRGRVYNRSELPNPYDVVEDHYVQIGENSYLGPSGGIDDFVNHSCNPNCGLKILATNIFLFAIKNIKTGQEVTWDYSTTMDEDDWEIDCNCGARNCRKRIRDFKYLSPKIKRRYMELGIVPKYIALTSSKKPYFCCPN